MRTALEVHKDCSPCPDVDPDSTEHCSLVGTGIHEMIDRHLIRVHGLSAGEILGIRKAALVADFKEEPLHRDVELMFRVHDGILLFQPVN